MNETNAFLSSHAVSTWMIDRFRIYFIDKGRSKELEVQPFCSCGHSEWMLQ